VETLKLDLELDGGRQANYVSPTGLASVTRLFLGFIGVPMVLYCAVYKMALSELALGFRKMVLHSVITSLIVLVKQGSFCRKMLHHFKKKNKQHFFIHGRYF